MFRFNNKNSTTKTQFKLPKTRKLSVSLVIKRSLLNKLTKWSPLTLKSLKIYLKKSHLSKKYRKMQTFKMTHSPLQLKIKPFMKSKSMIKLQILNIRLRKKRNKKIYRLKRY